MKVDIFYISPRDLYTNEEILVIENIGYAEVKSFNRDELWNLCNWSGYQNKKPDNLFSNLTACGSNVAFYNPSKDEYEIPLGFGWKTVKKYMEVVDHFNELKNKTQNQYTKSSSQTELYKVSFTVDNGVTRENHIAIISAKNIDDCLQIFRENAELKLDHESFISDYKSEKINIKDKVKYISLK